MCHCQPYLTKSRFLEFRRQGRVLRTIKNKFEFNIFLLLVAPLLYTKEEVGCEALSSLTECTEVLMRGR